MKTGLPFEASVTSALPSVRVHSAQGPWELAAGAAATSGWSAKLFPGPAAAHLPSGPRKDTHTLCICPSVRWGRLSPRLLLILTGARVPAGKGAVWLHGGREPAHGSGSRRPGPAPARGLAPLATSVSPSTHEPTACHPLFLPVPPSHCHSVLRPHVLQTSTDLMGAPVCKQCPASPTGTAPL